MVSRRTIITIPVALGAAGLTGRAAFAGSFDAAPSGSFDPDPSPARAVPRTMARQRELARGTVRGTPQQRVTHLGISWRGTGARITTRDAAGWTTWRVLDACTGGRDGAPTGGHALLVTPGLTEYRVTVTGRGAAGSVTELNTVDGPVIATAAAPLAGMPLPDGSACPVTYLPRAAWGADEGLRFAGGTEVWPPTYATTQALTVHHTAGANSDPDPAGTIRAIYYYQAVTQGWGDIGYHLLIDEQGRAYEGRWSGAEEVPVFAGTVPAGTRPDLVMAAHIGGYNTGNLGVCLLGNLTGQGPTPAARATLVTVLASLARVCRIDPEAVVNYVGPTGATRTVLGVSGHRDWAATECPGNTFYPQLAAVRADVAALLATPPSPSPSPTASRYRSPTPRRPGAPRP